MYGHMAMVKQRDAVILLPIPKKCANREIALKYIEMIEKKMNNVDKMIDNAVLEDRVKELERENAELKAQVEELKAANVKLSSDCDIYREGLAQICNEMSTEFYETVERATEELKMKLWNKTRSVLRNEGKAELYARMKQEFEDVFAARGAQRAIIQERFLERGYSIADIKAVAHMQHGARGNIDRLHLGDTLAALMYARKP